MTTYYWDVAAGSSGNFGAASSWSPNGTPTASDTTEIDETEVELYGSGSAQALLIGRDASVVVTGALTTDLSEGLVVGAAGGGSAGSAASVQVDATWTDTGQVVIGSTTDDGVGFDGFLSVNEGGSLSAGYIEVGTQYGPSGTSDGAVTVQNGGAITTSGLDDCYDEVGSSEGGTGALTVTGANSSWSSGAGLNIGDNGSGTLIVEASAALTTPVLNVGVSYAEPQDASGSGTVYIESGGVVMTTGAYNEIGDASFGSSTDAIETATGAVTVEGVGSEWIANNGAIEIGDAGSKSGSLTISEGAEVAATNEFDVGEELDGADGSYGTLLIESGGKAVTGGYAASNGENYDNVGANYSSAPSSKVTVTGTGSSWNMNATLAINGSGQVLAASGGEIEAETGVDMYAGSLLKVDSQGSIEDGDAGGATLGYLTVDPIAATSAAALEDDSVNSANLYGDGTIDANILDNGAIFASQGILTINGPTGGAGTVSGGGQLQIGAQGDLVLNASVAPSVTTEFLGFDGALTLTEPADFEGAILNFAVGDVIDLEFLKYSVTLSSYSVVPDESGGDTLVVTEGSTSVSLDIGSSLDALNEALTLSKDVSGEGTVVSFTSAATASPFHFWGSLGSLFDASSPAGNFEYASSAASDGGTPIWVETVTPAWADLPDYSILVSTQDWLGDIQTSICVASDSNFVDPFVTSAGAQCGDLAAPVTFSGYSGQTTGGVIYWAASSVVGDYEVEFQSLNINISNTPATSNLATLNGSPVTMIATISNPTSWTVSFATSASIVVEYTSATSSTTENLYMDGFDTSGSSTTAGPVLIATNVPTGTPYCIGYDESGYDYYYMEIGGSLGTGLVGGTFDATSGSLGLASLNLSLPNYTAFDGISSYLTSNGNSLRVVEGVVNHDDVIQTFVNASPTPQTTFHLSSASDYFKTTQVYDPNDGQMDYIALVYEDAGQVHLELLSEKGVQLGYDLVIPGLSSFLDILTLEGSTNSSSTRVEIDYEVDDPSGGQRVDGLIYDTASAPDLLTLNSQIGLYDGTPFDDTFTWEAGVYTINGGGGLDTLSASNLSASQVSISIDASGNAVVDDGEGDVDTLLGFTTIKLSDATVTISANTLAQSNSDGSKTVSTYNIAGQSFSSTVFDYDASGQIVSKLYEGVTGEGTLRSFEEFYSQGALIGSTSEYAGQWSPNFTMESLVYNGAGQLTASILGGGAITLSEAAYASDAIVGVGASAYNTSTQSVPTAIETIYVAGGGDHITLAAGSANEISLEGTTNGWDLIDGSNCRVNLVSAQSGVVGGGDVIVFTTSSDNMVGLVGTANDWDWIEGTSGYVNLHGAQSVVEGGGDVIRFVASSDNAVSLEGTANDWDWVYGSNGQIYLVGAQSIIDGGGDSVVFNTSSGNAVSLEGTANDWDWVSSSSGQIYLVGAQSVIEGGGNAVDFATSSGNAVSLEGTANDWDWVYGSNGQIYLVGAQSVIEGGGNSVDFATSSGNAVSLEGTANDWDWLSSSNGQIYLSGAQSVIEGGGNLIDFATSSGNAVSLEGTANDWDSVYGSNGQINIVGAQSFVDGGSNTIDVTGNSSVSLVGASDVFAFQRGIGGQDIIDGFGSSDKIDFSNIDFSSWSALSESISQVGDNTVITYDLNDRVTLTNVNAQNLNASQFHFA